MLIIGCDFHTRYQQIAMAREETAEMIVERRLDHASGEAQAFYRSLQSFKEPVRVGIEATGPIHWFERLLTELDHELWIGDSAKIRGGWPRLNSEKRLWVAHLSRPVGILAVLFYARVGSFSCPFSNFEFPFSSFTRGCPRLRFSTWGSPVR
jgi:hypothetical protein